MHGGVAWVGGRHCPKRATVVAAVVAGLAAGVAYTWYRSRRAITIIEARGHQHNLFR